jgi:hypothetical protein
MIDRLRLIFEAACSDFYGFPTSHDQSFEFRWPV